MNFNKYPYPPFRVVFLIVAAAIVCNASLKYIGGLGKNDSAEKIINDYAAEQGFLFSDYPNEIVNLFKMNEETKDFVLNYPSKIIDFTPEIIDFSEYQGCTEPPMLMQWDLRWGYLSYDESVMGLSGSAPTALSMAALYEKQDISLTPVKMAELAKAGGMENKPEKLLSEGARSLDMTVMEIPKNDKRLRQAVSDAGCVVVCTTDGKLLSGAIVIRGIDSEGKYLINDTLSSRRSQKSYTFAEIGSHLRKVWKYSLD